MCKMLGGPSGRAPRSSAAGSSGGAGQTARIPGRRHREQTPPRARMKPMARLPGASLPETTTGEEAKENEEAAEHRRTWQPRTAPPPAALAGDFKRKRLLGVGLEAEIKSRPARFAFGRCRRRLLRRLRRRRRGRRNHRHRAKGKGLGRRHGVRSTGMVRQASWAWSGAALCRALGLAQETRVLRRRSLAMFPVPGRNRPLRAGSMVGGGTMKLLPHIGHWATLPICDSSPCKTCPWGQQNWNDMFYPPHDSK